MTDASTVPSRGVDVNVASAVAQLLGAVVVDLTALSVDGKQAHWHVRGSNFQAVHELLDDLVHHARKYADIAAERAVALGMPIDARVQTVGSRTSTPRLSGGFRPGGELIAEVIQQVDATMRTVRAAVDGLEHVDPVSQDVAIQIARGLEKRRWFLFAHIAQ